MSVELKVFGGAYFPKDKALKKNPDLKPLAISIKSTTKAVAEAVIYGKLAAEYPERLEDYFKAKIWEDREGLPCPALDIFSSEFFGAAAVWIDKPGEPAPVPAESETNAGNQDDAEPVLKSVKQLDQNSRAACLVLFGPVEEITAAQYGQVVDLTNDDESSFNQNLAIAITKETRALALEPERRVQLLAWVREKASETAQWPDIKKLLAKWIDMPADKREQATSTTSSQQRTESGATMVGGNPTDRSPDLAHNLQTLGIEVALAILSCYDDIDIYSIPSRFLIPAKGMSEAAADSKYTTWFDLLRSTPGILDYSRAAIIALIKSTPRVLWLKPVELREHINRELVESDHANPDQKTIDIACSAAPRNIPEAQNEKTQQVHNDKAELPAVCPARAAELDKELHEAFAHHQHPQHDQTANDQPKIENIGGGVFPADALIAQQPSNTAQTEEAPGLLTEREQSIKALIEQVLAGNTALFDEEEAGTLIANAGHDFSHLAMMIMIDIFALENGENPEIIDDFDIQHLAWGALEEWSDNPETRLDILTRLLGEYRKQDAIDRERNERCKKEDLSPSKSVQIPESVNQSAITLTYQQQLTIAALQGLCANPAYCTTSDEIPDMARQMARSITLMESAE